MKLQSIALLNSFVQQIKVGPSMHDSMYDCAVSLYMYNHSAAGGPFVCTRVCRSNFCSASELL